MTHFLVLFRAAEGFRQEELTGLLAKAQGVEWLKSSSIYRVQGVGASSKEIHDLRSAVPYRELVFTIRGRTRLLAEEVLGLLKELEQRWQQHSARDVLRIHLVMYGVETRMLPQLCLPDPELHSEPAKIWTAAEVAPDWMHPVLGVDLRTLANKITNGNWGDFSASGAGILDFSEGHN